VTSWDSSICCSRRVSQPLLSPHVAAVGGSSVNCFFPPCWSWAWLTARRDRPLRGQRYGVISLFSIAAGEGFRGRARSTCLWGTLLVFSDHFKDPVNSLSDYLLDRSRFCSRPRSLRQCGGLGEREPLRMAGDKRLAVLPAARFACATTRRYHGFRWRLEPAVRAHPAWWRDRV